MYLSLINYFVFTSKEIKISLLCPVSCSSLAQFLDTERSSVLVEFWSGVLSAQQLPISSMTFSNNSSCAGFCLHVLLRIPECQCSLPADTAE